MKRPQLIQLVALLVCGGLIYGSSRLMPAINAGRQQLNMYGSADVLANTPPEYAFAIQAFGAFRSVIVNMAFIRAETYKEQGRYFDAMQLASWICKLQPRFPTVWEFQSWNMAWNISVTTFTAAERWNWVYNGIKLLRDEGIRWNPRAVNLYKQLAWTYNNKMSENLDDFHWDYKRNWAWRMHLLLGPAPVALGGFRPGAAFKPVVVDVADDPLREVARAAAEQNEEKRRRRHEEEDVPFRTTKTLEERMKGIPGETPEAALTPEAVAKRVAYDFLKAIDDAPRTLAELYAQVPETREMVAKLRELGVVISDDPLDEDSYWYDGKLAATFFARYRELADTPALRASIERDQAGALTEEEKKLARLDEIVGVRAGRPAGRALLRFLQRKVLAQVYKLEPARMAYLTENFGPLDWRVPDAQSLYWVVEGLIKSGESLHTFENDKVNTARIIFFSLRNLFQRNRLTFEPNPTDITKSYINFAPDPNFIASMHRAFTTYGPLIDPDPGDASGAGDMFRTGHINFLSEAIRMLYFTGRLDEAEAYYEYLRTHYSRRHDPTPDTTYTKPLRDFVVGTFYGDIEGPRETERVIADLLFRAYGELANEDVESYTQYVSKALDFHQAYAREKRDQTSPRMQLRPFQDYQIDVFRLWFAVPVINSNATIHKARLWRAAPLRLKQFVYDDLIEGLRRECDAWSFDLAKAFPEPPDLEQFRKTHPRREVERREPTAETPAQAGGD